jgi:holo-ACP synthase / triphosphoribosyl-dephospho-CoA synthase
MQKIDPLAIILEAREQRALQKVQLAHKGYPCVSLSLNVPGFPKSNAIVQTFFRQILDELSYFLKAHLIEILDNEGIVVNDAAGDYYLAPIATGSLGISTVKQICEQFEECHPLGRFIDVDLNDHQGNAVSSGKSKLCFFCHKKPAVECRRQNTHNHTQLRSFMFPAMADYCRRQRERSLGMHLSSLGIRAILCEISLSPKPGLVDKFSDGSHSDMNYQTFLASSAAISGWFAELAEAGLSMNSDDHSKALPMIRNIGLRMETAMFDSTRNINTQKGIIFLMGISLFACGMIYRQSDYFNVELFRMTIRNFCRGLVGKELQLNGHSEMSHGEEVFQKYGFGGARGEAESGFPTVFEHGLPQLSLSSVPDDEALSKCLLAIASHNNDTNILYRRGPDVLAKFQKLCLYALENFNETNFTAVAEFCKSENISPGGSADLLAVTIFVKSVIDADPGKKILPLIVEK